MDALSNYSWPGNIRELENLLERAVILSPGKELRVPLSELKSAPSPPQVPTPLLPLLFNSVYLLHLFNLHSGGSRAPAHPPCFEANAMAHRRPKGAAVLLGMKRTTLQARMRKLGIRRPVVILAGIFPLVFSVIRVDFCLPAERGAHETSHPTVPAGHFRFLLRSGPSRSAHRLRQQEQRLVDDATHTADQVKFDEIEEISEGLGPLYNAQSCRECHQNPTSGGSSQVSELRVGHRGPDGKFQNPEIPIARGTEVIKGRTLVNDRAICPNAAFPSTEIQERVPDSEEDSYFPRFSERSLGDGFVEAVPDQTFIDLAKDQCRKNHKKICGQVLYVPILEAPGQTGVGRFGWKDQHASLLSFSADAYLNEMGITSRLQPDEVTNLCNTASEPNDTPGRTASPTSIISRASCAPPKLLRATRKLRKPPEHARALNCSTKWAATSATSRRSPPPEPAQRSTAAPSPSHRRSRKSSFIPTATSCSTMLAPATASSWPCWSTTARRCTKINWKNLSISEYNNTANKIRTAPLWGVRLHSRLMHDGASVTLLDAILRHGGEAKEVTEKFRKLKPAQKEALLEFLRSFEGPLRAQPGSQAGGGSPG